MACAVGRIVVFFKLPNGRVVSLVRRLVEENLFGNVVHQ